MQLIRKVRPILAIGMMCLFIIHNFQSVLQEIAAIKQIPLTDGSFFVEWETRFDPIKEDLPFSQGTIGYAADWDVPGVAFSPANADAEHILTQYSMAPIVVTRDPDRDWVIVNMNPNTFETWVSLQEGDFALTRYKKNLYLIHRLK